MKIDVAVADSGPLRYLAVINHADVLEHLFGKILVPEAVRAELLHPNSPPPIKSFLTSPPSWVQFAHIRDISKLSPIVHRGEQSAFLKSPLNAT